jgi:hypothetical protein
VDYGRGETGVRGAGVGVRNRASAARFIHVRLRVHGRKRKGSRCTSEPNGHTRHAARLQFHETPSPLRALALKNSHLDPETPARLVKKPRALSML